MVHLYMDMDTKVEKEILSIAEFAALHSICRATVNSEIKKGNLKAKKVGARILIRLEDARAWANALDDVNP